jgi:FixJ family two-component response regulator
MAAGFDGFLVKPFEFATLADTVERVCATAVERERSRAS